ncbi:MAG: NADH-quinone oxidoreductase subunit A [Verrucomicrobiae bacterium]|nr:NADH-quinone oxidoreductase subunit A [Verrucomicrobiae bacterium]MDW7980688.1 NADH-quinone oxidoreductase subunit A [Verrucomicrobiales bacterium]
MDEKYFVDLVYLAAFCAGGLAFALVPFALVRVLAARHTRAVANKTLQPVECGVEPIGDAWVRFSAVYYLYALVFVAFAVDVLFLVPVALVYDRAWGWGDFALLAVFVAVLSLVIVYAWSKGYFEWRSNKPNG